MSKKRPRIQFFKYKQHEELRGLPEPHFVMAADESPCSWCSGTGFVGLHGRAPGTVPCRECGSTGVEQVRA
jgi:hypothetical protein